jgi:ribosomal protein S4
MNQKKRYKPFYKNFLNLRENIQDRPKVFKFKKQKWKKFQYSARKELRFFRRYRIRDQFQLLVSKFKSKGKGNSFKKRFRNTLKERKLFSFFYGGLKKKYLKKHFNSILKKKHTNTSNFNIYKHNTLKFFESRLDTVIHRAKFSFSIKSAGQLILHGHILVNGVTVRIKSYQVKNNDLIEIAYNIKSRNLIKKSIDRSNFWPLPQKHLVINYNTLQILFILNNKFNIIPIFNHYLNINSLFINLKK